MNRIRETLNMLKKAHSSNVSGRLSKRENWTPDLVYVHVSRLIIGTILGMVLGISLYRSFIGLYVLFIK